MLHSDSLDAFRTGKKILHIADSILISAYGKKKYLLELQCHEIVDTLFFAIPNHLGPLC